MEEKYLTIMKERESGQICFGNTIINTRVSILNYPKGFLRKKIIKNLIEEPIIESWDLKYPFQFEIFEKIYLQSEIKKKRIIKIEKTKCSLLVCHRNEVELWKKALSEVKNSLVVTYERRNKYKFKLDFGVCSIIIIPDNDFVSFINDRLDMKAVYRLFVCDPELFDKINSSLPHIYYNFCWLISSDPHHLLNLQKQKEKYSFLNNFIPEQIDYHLYNTLQICKDLKIQETLRHHWNLPEYFLIKHECRDELYTILRQHLDDDIYTALDKGNYRLVLQKLNATSEYNNIWDYINDSINNELQDLNTQLTKVKMDNSNTKLELIETIKEKIDNINRKRKRLYSTINKFTTDSTCAICNEEYGATNDVSILFCCQNLICSKCLFKWMNTNKKCPYCVQTIFNDTLHSLKFPINPNNEQNMDTHSSSFKELHTRQETIFNIIKKYITQSNIMFYSESETIITTMQVFCEENNIQFMDFSSNFTYKEKKKLLVDDDDQQRRLYVITSYRDLIGFSFENKIDHFISYSFLSKYCYKYICSRFYRVGRPTNKPFYFHTFFSY